VTTGWSMWDAKIYCCVSMQIQVFGTQFCNCEDTDMIWKQMQNYLLFVVSVYLIRVFFFLVSRCLVCPNHTKINHMS
jgi:hypothetical protein